jgi:hypothetical protein
MTPKHALCMKAMLSSSVCGGGVGSSCGVSADAALATRETRAAARAAVGEHARAAVGEHARAAVGEHSATTGAPAVWLVAGAVVGNMRAPVGEAAVRIESGESNDRESSPTSASIGPENSRPLLILSRGSFLSLSYIVTISRRHGHPVQKNLPNSFSTCQKGDASFSPRRSVRIA